MRVLRPILKGELDMRTAICHYSLHRCCTEESWTLERLAEEVSRLGVEGIDFHAHFLKDSGTAAERIKAAVAQYDLTLSSLSLSNNFSRENKAEFDSQVATAIEWVRVAAEAGAGVSRIFGGDIACEDRANADILSAAKQRVLDGLGAVVREAEKLGVVLALENHVGLPNTGEEQIEFIEAVNSPNLKANVDVANYMIGGQEGHVGTRIAAQYAAYVHFKDYAKLPDEKDGPFGCGIVACVPGEGAVDLPQCLAVLRDAGYDGFIALEYEADEDEKTGVPRSLDYMKRLVDAI